MNFGVVALGMIGLLGWSGAALAQTPKARTGFQADFRTGFSFATGKIEGVYGVADVTNAVLFQVPLLVDIGSKVSPEVFIGGYSGFSFGGGTCATECASSAFHLGAEVQYHILPNSFVNPWVGYGLGLELLVIAPVQGYQGFEFARFMGGADFRLSRVFGVGPFVDFSMTAFNEHGIGKNLTLGARFVLFP